MQISNDTAALNYVNYFTKQLPINLANMAALQACVKAFQNKVASISA